MDRSSEYFKQVQLLVRALPFIDAEQCFALKGGTAINLFYQDLPRLSVDIDLTYLPIEDRDTSLANIRTALDNIAGAIAGSIQDTEVRHSKDAQDSLRLLVKSPDCQIKIELSPVLRGTVWPVERKEVTETVEELFGYAELQLVSEEDLYAGKMCAALDRQHPRDLFDIHLYLKKDGLTRRQIQTFLVYLISSNRPIVELLAPIPKDISDIYVSEFQTMARQDVPLETLISTRSSLVSAIHTALTDEDKAFLISFKKREPDWSLMSLPNISEMPAVRWKQINLGRMSDAKHAEALNKLEQVLSGELE